MGDVVGGILGGGKSSSGQTSGKTGFASLPKELQKAFTQYGTQVTDQFASPQGQAFTPMGQTGDETAAFGMARNGLASPGQFNSDIAMLMNPYDQYVVNDINRQAQGQNSLVNQAANQVGQMGSNRSFLASSDVEQNRLNNIGQFRQGQYNTAVQNALGPLAGLHQQDMTNLLGIGNFQRGLGQQTQQAPFNALSQYGSLLGAIPQGTNNPNTATKGMEGGSFGQTLGNIGNIAKTAMSLFSDSSLKEDIVHVGEQNGYNIYEFKYIGLPNRYRGVMAQEVMEVMPEAVREIDGYLAVDYSMIGLRMEEV